VAVHVPCRTHTCSLCLKRQVCAAQVAGAVCLFPSHPSQSALSCLYRVMCYCTLSRGLWGLGHLHSRQCCQSRHSFASVWDQQRLAASLCACCRCCVPMQGSFCLSFGRRSVDADCCRLLCDTCVPSLLAVRGFQRQVAQCPVHSNCHSACIFVTSCSFVRNCGHIAL
jgi:hypothetical protein